MDIEFQSGMAFFIYISVLMLTRLKLCFPTRWQCSHRPRKAKIASCFFLFAMCCYLSFYVISFYADETDQVLCSNCNSRVPLLQGKTTATTLSCTYLRILLSCLGGSSSQTVTHKSKQNSHPTVCAICET